MKLLGIELRQVPKVAHKSAAEVWVTADGERIPIGEMSESHAKHSLAMIMRHLRAGEIATLNRKHDRVKFVRVVPLEPPEDADIMSIIDPLGQDSFHYGKPGDPGVDFPLLPFSGRRS